MSATSVLPSSSSGPKSDRPRSAVRARTTASVRTRYRRQTAALMLGTTVVGLWLGLAAPSVSPVSPVASAPVASGATDPVAGATAPTGGDRVAGDRPQGRDARHGHRR